MNHKNIIITSIAVTLLFAFSVFAHGGFDHVQGTVVKVDNNVLTVKTAKGNVDVKLNPKTEITQNSKPALASDLVPNARVIVDVEEGKDIAHSVKIGAQTKLEQKHHLEHK